MADPNVPPALLELQRQFKRYLTDEANTLSRHIVDAGAVNAAERLDVYHEAYHLRLAEALEADFGTVRALLGDVDFTRLARAYIEQHPSEHPSIRWFGRHLTDFIAATPAWNARPALLDTAALDWAISLSFDAADGPVFELEGMAGVPPEAWADMRFALHPSMRTVDLYWNAPALRGAADAEEPPPAPERADLPVRWLVWRQDMTAMYRSMDVDEAFSLQAAADGASFGDICEGLCEWIEPQHAALHAAGMLKTWLTEQIVSDIDWT